MMRAKTFCVAVAAVCIGYVALTAPEIVGFTLMALGALGAYLALRLFRRSGMRR